MIKKIIHFPQKSNAIQIKNERNEYNNIDDSYIYINIYI